MMKPILYKQHQILGKILTIRGEVSREEVLTDRVVDGYEVEEVANEIPVATSDEGNGQPQPTRVSNRHR